MNAGCLAFFVVLVAVALGSWLTGGGKGARLVGLGALILMVLYYALANWTAQSLDPPTDPSGRFRGFESWYDWKRYARNEGLILWGAFLFLALAALWVALRG
ncbi:MAG: hypothetical protein ACE5JJ_07320 [Nitrospinota bacterium]